MKKKNIICFHLFNDYSGSPKVLTMILEELIKKGYNIELLTSGDGGALDKLKNLSGYKLYKYKYKFSENKAIEIFKYIIVQLQIFFFSFKYAFSKNTVFYINTLLPVGAALAGFIMRKRIIYHYHENADSKGLIYKTLAYLMQFLADDIICVSKYQASFLKKKQKVSIIYNVLSLDLIKELNTAININTFEKKNILMLSSLKTYKGITEFIELSRNLKFYKFTLIINDSKEQIDLFFKQNSILPTNNLIVYSRQTNIVQFYKEASIVLNLSNKNKFIETFGLTVLEAFTAGLPVIVPTVGGIAELVDEGVNGYKIDVQNINLISDKIKEILSDKNLYDKLRYNAFIKANQFNPSTMLEKIENIIKK